MGKSQKPAPFTVTAIEEIAGSDNSRAFRVEWSTVADDGLAELAEAIVSIGTDLDPETVISEFLAGRREARDRHNSKERAPAPVEPDREPRAELLAKIGPKVDRK